MNMIQILAVTIVGMFLSILLRQYKREYSIAVEIATVIAVMGMIISKIAAIAQRLLDLSSNIGLNASYIKLLIKVLGVCIITQLVSDICKDSGENAMSSQVELAGKIIVISLSLPIVEVLIQLVAGIIG